MKQIVNDGQSMPTANLAINKSRLKLYNKNSNTPTYYLEKGQEFQIELFNPTTGNILAKISLNGKPIAQGGLVLRPGERVFLDRYIDVARKFKFDTYEVANTLEVRKAIENNGDFKVEFKREYIPEPTIDYFPGLWTINTHNTFGGPNIRGIVNTNNFKGTLNNTSGNVNYDQKLSTTNVSSNYSANVEPTLDMSFMDQELSRETKSTNTRSLKSKKSIETGRVEMGSQSDQQMTTVNMNWEIQPFHTVEYKMLPTSQKVNTVQDVQVKRYCTNCGTKQKPAFKFCPNCGVKC